MRAPIFVRGKRKVEYKKPEKEALNYWRVKKVIGLIFLVALFVAGRVILNLFEIFETGTPAGNLVNAAAIVLVLLQIVSIFVLPAIEYRQWEYAITDDRVVIKHGIFFIAKTVIPIIRIQNVNTNQGPIQRIFKLYSVELALASGTFDIVGLSKETAEDISEKLNARLRARLAANEKALGDSVNAGRISES